MRFPVQSVRFLDGSRQTYQLSGTGLRRWAIRLDSLDEAEAGHLIAFAEAQRDNTFSFTDPVSGNVAPRCVIAGNELRVGMTAEGNAWSEMFIEEVL